MNAEQLKTTLADHALWLADDNRQGKRAILSGANLSGASLRGANLSGVNLSGADLSGADLRGAILQTGERWEAYLVEVVPALLTAGGKSVAQIVASGAWQCHSWDNCPMAIAFGVNAPDKTPRLLHTRVEQFVQLFDAGLIPEPEVLLVLEREEKP